MRKTGLALLLAALLASLAGPVRGEPASTPAPHGRPRVTLDQLDLSKATNAIPEEAYLRKALAREARKADWGVGRGHDIEYRFRIDELTVSEEKNVVRVSCTASGWLPKSRHAKSHLTFGGAPKDRQKVVEHVLDIVVSGVMTRLAEMERKRRAQ